MHTAPNPAHRFPVDAAIAESYRELDADRVPSGHRVFIALRVDPATSRAAIDARGGGGEGAQRALKRCVARVVSLLEATGVPARALADEPLRAALAEVAGTGPVATGNARRTAESRRWWQIDGATHVTSWVRTWPRSPAPVRDLVDLAASVPALSCDVSLTLYPGDHLGDDRFVRCRALIRTTSASTDAAEAATTTLAELATASGVRLRRLDGEQRPGFAATLPLGGGTP